VRIWVQSNTALVADAKWKPYLDAETAHLEEVKLPGTELHFDGVDVMQPDLTHNAMHRAINTQGFIQKGIRAQEEGYDAVIVLGMATMGREELREQLSIPIVFTQDVAWPFAAWLYGRFGLLSHDRVMYLRRYDQIRASGLAECFVHGDYGTLRKEDTLAAYADFDAYHARLEETARRAVHDGANVLIPDLGPTNTLLAAQGVTRMLGVPIFDTSAMALRAAQMMVGTGLRNVNPW
jgi:allantoin racemase